MAHHATKPANCANCDYAFVPGQPDEFCPRCGQQNHAVEIGFGHVAEEFLEGIFHFDGKVFSTAKLLLFRPGELTRRSLAGHRVPYVPPSRLYMFISSASSFSCCWAPGWATRKAKRARKAQSRLPRKKPPQSLRPPSSPIPSFSSKAKSRATAAAFELLSRK